MLTASMYARTVTFAGKYAPHKQTHMTETLAHPQTAQPSLLYS